MQLSQNWASIEDFAILFQYLWHRDFPIDDTKAIGAKRIDWNIHTGVIVRNIADLMSLTARFEQEGRIDAILRSTDGEIAVEWEWEEIVKWLKRERGNELNKLKKQKKHLGPRKYSVLIAYSERPDDELAAEVYQPVFERWKGTGWSLLLILITYGQSRKFSSRREFKDLRFSLFDNTSYKEIRIVPACPWKVEGTRWTLLICKGNMTHPGK